MSILATKRSLKTRIVVTAVFLFVLCLATLTLLIGYLQHNSMRRLLFSQQTTTATYVARDIDGKLKTRLNALETVARNVPLALLADTPASRHGLDQWLQDRRAIYTLFSGGLMVVRPDGNGAFADYPLIPERRTNTYLDRDWFNAARETGKPAISKPLMGRAVKEPVVVMAIPVFDQRHQLRTVLAGVTRLNTPGFLDLVKEIKLGKTGEFMVIDSKHGLYVTGTDSSLTLAPVREAWQSPLLTRFMNGADGAEIATNSTGVEEMVSGVPIPTANWFLVSRLPTQEAFAPIRESLTHIYLAGSALILLFVLLLWIALDRMLKPISMAAHSMKAMAQGDQPLQALPAERNDEIGHLVDSFNALQDQIHRQNQEIQKQAFHDPLTGLPNRLLLLDRMEHSLMRTHRDGGSIAVLFLDLDGFKPINDSLGHDAGDLVLQEVAARLQSLVRRSDTVARFGGDEFVILLPVDEDTHVPEIIAGKAIQSLSFAFHPAPRTEVGIGVSIGIACYPQHADTAEKLITAADAAMYQAKKAGRNRYFFAEDTSDPDTVKP